LLWRARYYEEMLRLLTAAGSEAHSYIITDLHLSVIYGRISDKHVKEAIAEIQTRISATGKIDCSFHAAQFAQMAASGIQTKSIHEARICELQAAINAVL